MPRHKLSAPEWRSRTSTQPRFRRRLLERGQVLEWKEGASSKGDSARQTEWGSREEWDQSKPGWDWLFPFIDKNKDGKISAAEYAEFQDYKRTYPDWQKRLKDESRGE